jgi:hypothetical protein
MSPTKRIIDTLHRHGTHTEIGWRAVALETGAFLASTDDLKEATTLLTGLSEIWPYAESSAMAVQQTLVTLLSGWLQVRGQSLSMAAELADLRRQNIELKSQVTTLECMALGARSQA